MISFIVPLYNHVEHSKTMLESLIKTIPASVNYEIILIDDASTDDTKEWLDALHLPNVRILYNLKNLGYARTNNIAVKHASGEILVLLNNDLIFDGDWLSPLLAMINSDFLNVGIVGNIQNRVADNEIDHAGIVLSNNGQFCHRLTIDGCKPYSKQLAVTGACIVLRKIDFEKVGGFDEGFLNGAEDIDLNFKVRELGKDIYLSHNSVIRHHVSLSRDRTHIQNEINSRRLFNKWRGFIKNELSRIWSQLILTNSAQEIESVLDGQLINQSSQVVSRIVAENLIANHEHHWRKLIDAEVFPRDLTKNCSFKRLTYLEHENHYLINGNFEFCVKDIDSAVNFYLCGRRINLDLAQNIAIKITVNDIQQKVIFLGNDLNINVGIINPILIKGIENTFKVSVNFFNPSDQTLHGDASKLIYIQHIIFDDVMIGAKH